MKIVRLMLLPAVALLAACGAGDPNAGLPGKVGPAGEVVMVVAQQYWESPIVEAMRQHTETPYELLPQMEPRLDLVLLDPNEFDRFWKPHRNIVMVDLADRIDTQEPSLKVFRNKYASDQVYAEVKGKSVEAIAKALREQGNAIVAAVSKAEVRRAGNLVAAYPNEALTKEIAEKYSIKMEFPRDARAVKRNDEFIWVQREMTRMKGGNNHDVKQGFFIYMYPYDTDSVFSFQWLINKRNDMLYRYVQGEPKNSYMTTEMLLTPRYEELEFNGMFMAELRGLWRMENDFMGGPFYSMTLFDEANQRIVTLDGYAYAPYFNKREYIREVEGILKTVQFLSKPNA